jgi:nuclear protein localization family protein 4
MDAGKGDGSVVCKRHAGSYFLFGAEIISAARAQTAKPLACKWSGTGIHTSRFVTCAITGMLIVL